MTNPSIEENLESIGEAITNVITHGLGAFLSIAALVILVAFSVLSPQHTTLKVVSSVLYGSSLIALYMSSTLYHSFRHPRFKHYFRILDHSTIYLLIAGTYTPFTLITLHGSWGWTLFSIEWGLAIFGITFKLWFWHRFETLSLIIYLIMGWLIVIAIEPLYHSLPPWGLFWMVAGGLAYTGGIVFYASDRIPYGHSIWHVFVLAGSICHFFGILFYVIM